jgi:hypothetical protein
MSAKAELKQKLNQVLMKGQLAAKWCPRKKEKAIQLRNAWNMTPKQYRKYLVDMTEVTETLMCNKDWDNINFSHVPSLASSRYKTAFYRNAEAKFTEYVFDKLVKGDKSVKVNAGAVYPYDVLKGLVSYYPMENIKSATELNHAKAQWDSLENFIGDASIFPMVDVSGSMTCKVGGNSSKSSITCLDVAVSLGLYCADKNKGPMGDAWLTFSAAPTIEKLSGDILQKVKSMVQNRDWGMNTNLHAAFESMLKMAVENSVSKEDMPEILLIFSDMQFDYCAKFDDSAMEMIKRKYEDAGYNVPQIVFWNLNSSDNVPVKFNQKGTALVSGFSPAIMKAILAANFEDFTPENIMLSTIMNERYDF